MFPTCDSVIISFWPHSGTVLLCNWELPLRLAWLPLEPNEILTIATKADDNRLCVKLQTPTGKLPVFGSDFYESLLLQFKKSLMIVKQAESNNRRV